MRSKRANPSSLTYGNWGTGAKFRGSVGTRSQLYGEPIGLSYNIQYIFVHHNYGSTKKQANLREEYTTNLTKKVKMFIKSTRDLVQ